MKIVGFLSVFFFLLYSGVAQQKATQNNGNEIEDLPRESKSLRVVFYNVENLFDIYNDSLKNDEEFLPDGDKHWDNYKFYKKIANIGKTLIAVGGWEAPEIIGLCEVENFFCLNQLVKKSSLARFNYNIIHRESPDARGIDVGMIYRPEKFHPLYIQPINVTFPFDDGKTRDILYVKGLAFNVDTLHLFINHWPSRMGGQAASEPRRIFVAGILRGKIDSLMNVNPKSKIVIMGDLNDDPQDKSINISLNALAFSNQPQKPELINLSYPMAKNGEGTLVYKDPSIGYRWNLFDQIIVSSALLNAETGLFISPNAARIFKAPFLLEKGQDGFEKPFRTYAGFKFIGGFSDHLPIYLDIKLK